MALIGVDMNLKEYLFVKRMSITEFSELIDYSRTHLSGVINGQLKASKKLARAIERATNGEVKAFEVLGDQEGESNG